MRVYLFERFHEMIQKRAKNQNPLNKQKCGCDSLFVGQLFWFHLGARYVLMVLVLN